MATKFDKALRVLDQVLSRGDDGFGSGLLVFPRDNNSLNNGRYIVFTPFTFRNRISTKFNESANNKTFQSVSGGSANLSSLTNLLPSSLGSSFIDSIVGGITGSSLFSAVETVSRDFNNVVGSTNESTQKPIKEFVSDAMYLYMPNNIEVSYGQEWETLDAPILGQLREEALNGTDTTDFEFIDKMKVNLKSLQNVFVDHTANAIDEVSLVRRQATNPYKEPLYKGIQPRKFRFSFQLVPRNESDCRIIADMIKRFKLHSAPESLDNARSFGFPDEWNIDFYPLFDKITNPYLFKIGTCICNNIMVNYTPDGLFTAYRNGHPISVDLSLEFTEVELVTRDKVEEGY